VVVTVTIAPSARGHAVIEMNVNGVNRGMTSVTYRSCRTAGGFYAQGIAFTHPPFRGCVPVDVTVAGPARDPPRHPASVRQPLHIGPSCWLDDLLPTAGEPGMAPLTRVY
jgi:Ni,Fe-hydrogenase III small subunit